MSFFSCSILQYSRSYNFSFNTSQIFFIGQALTSLKAKKDIRILSFEFWLSGKIAFCQSPNTVAAFCAMIVWMNFEKLSSVKFSFLRRSLSSTLINSNYLSIKVSNNISIIFIKFYQLKLLKIFKIVFDNVVTVFHLW